MRICQNPNCSNPFNPDDYQFCISCGQGIFDQVLRNRYRVLRLLGEGGFSRTYAAEDVDRLDAPCVIKQFFPQVQGTVHRTKAAEFFKEEAFRLYQLGENHPQIPRLLAYFAQGSTLYLVQEFIHGKTLLEEAQELAYDQAQIRQLLVDLLPVLEFIHQQNVIHRDIKPENIIRHNVDGKPVLIDFGGAKQVTQTSIARQATAIYTLGYAPTEQMAGFASPASDLYALGVTCVRLLTQDFPGQDTNGHLQDPLYDPMTAKWLWEERLEEKGTTISDDLKSILNKLLKHFPKERYQSATEVLHDLEIVSSPVVFKPSSITKLVSSPLITLSPPASTAPTKILVPLPPLLNFDFYIVTVDTFGKEVDRYRHSAKYFGEELGKNVTIEMVSIPGGTFMMGSPDFTGGAEEHPQHEVSISPLFMGKYPVTQTQWKAVAALPEISQPLKPYPSKFKGANLPVENVSWYEATEFCARLSSHTGREYRLPSEAEWEYACRAGTTTAFHFGEVVTSALVNCNGGDAYIGRSRSRFRRYTSNVGSYEVANAFGLYDMHGSVWEWCADPWHINYHGAPIDGSVWLVGGDPHRRVLRGGSWNFSAELCRSASRSWNEADDGLRLCGFRIVFSADS